MLLTMRKFRTITFCATTLSQLVNGGSTQQWQATSTTDNNCKNKKKKQKKRGYSKT